MSCAQLKCAALPTHWRNGDGPLADAGERFSDFGAHNGVLKKGPLVFVTAAPKKATGGVTPVANNYQKSIAGIFL